MQRDRPRIDRISPTEPKQQPHPWDLCTEQGSKRPKSLVLFGVFVLFLWCGSGEDAIGSEVADSDRKPAGWRNSLALLHINPYNQILDKCTSNAQDGESSGHYECKPVLERGNRATGVLVSKEVTRKGPAHSCTSHATRQTVLPHPLLPLC